MISRHFFLPVLLMAVGACAQTAVKTIEPNGPAKSANALKEYVQLRNDLPGSDGVTV
jgi:hypothetical protein